MTRIETGALALALSLTVAFPLAAQGVGPDPLAANYGGEAGLLLVPSLIGAGGR